MSKLRHKTLPKKRTRGMKIIGWVLILSVLGFVTFSGFCYAGPLPSFPSAKGSISTLYVDAQIQAEEAERHLDIPVPEEPIKPIADPLEPINRIFFHVNDKFYFWALKPVASGYKAVFPQPVRVSVRNFFSNIATPVRLANCLLQFNFKRAGTETARFFLNTTIGLAGFFDPAKKRFSIDKQQEDFGQTLGFYRIGAVFYIILPILGPSSLRDGVGLIADGFLDPWNYLVTSIPVNLGVKAYDRVNRTSLTIGEYEDLKEAALDPYIALRDAYHQFRQEKIKGR
jgi:phospholipid-binding lipoprotein MlaA